MRALLFILLTLVSMSPALAQEPVTFIGIDTATYRAYLEKDWDRIIDLGKEATGRGIDYYYLRLRIGYAYFMKSRYSMAVPHYKKALEFSTDDATALEYLYYSYRYTGRDHDAEKLAARFSPALKELLKRRNKDWITGLSFYPTYGTGADPALKDEITGTAPAGEEGSQILPNSFKNYNLNVSHRIGRSIILRHSAHLLYKDEYSYAVVNSFPYISGSQVVRQYNYHFSADITPVAGFTVIPFASYINYRIPLFYEYGTGSGNSRTVYRNDIHEESVFGLKGQGSSGIFRFSAAGSHSNLNLSEQNTAAASLTILPLGNLNLYMTTNAYLHFQKHDEDSRQQFMQSVRLGFRPVKHIWIEGYTTHGRFSNLYDAFSEITYNSIESYKSISNINLIVPFYKSGISLFAGYRYYQSESMFVPVDHVLETQNHKSISYQSFTFGISWKP